MEEENEAIKSKHGRYIVHSATAAYICHLLVLVLKYGSLLSDVGPPPQEGHQSQHRQVRESTAVWQG